MGGDKQKAKSSKATIDNLIKIFQNDNTWQGASIHLGGGDNVRQTFLSRCKSRQDNTYQA